MAHFRADVICEIVDFISLHYIDSTQEAALRARITNATDEEKWGKIYKIIFPGTPDDAIPSPCK